jgi:exopolysaccharide biosynthesis polyprenyl glycosylphosphotransferase
LFQHGSTRPLGSAPSPLPDVNPTAASQSPKRESGPRAAFGSDPLSNTRLLLQSEGPETTRRHLTRSVSRVVSLFLLDLSTWLTLRAGIRLLRDDKILGANIASEVYAVFPLGSLKGVQFFAALTIGLFVFGTYARGDNRRDAARIARGVIFGTALTLWSSLWVQPPHLVIVQGIIVSAIVWSAITLGRLLFELLLQWVFQTSPDSEPIVFVGERTDLDSQWVRNALLGPNRNRRSEWVDVPSAGHGIPEPVERVIERIHATLKAAHAHTIVLCGDLPKPSFEAIVEAASSAGIRVLTVARVSGVVQRHTGFVWYNGTPFVELTVPGLHGWQQLVKRILDFTVTAVGLVLLSPLFLVIAVAVKLDSPGPVFFLQDRVGYAGRVFRVWKFRTMRATAEMEKAALAHLNVTGDQRLFKIPHDPRVTRVGRFLRRYSLDEFPQFFNVLAGDMSLVGPRPFFPSDLRGYLDHHFARLGAKPGITGLWQVKGRSDVTDFEEVVRLDREYLDRWSLLLDLWILLRTIPVVLKGRGAY